MTTQTPPKVAVIGAGLIGRAWAITFARGGAEVALYDPLSGAAEAALGFVDGVLDDLAANGLLRGASPSAIRGRMSVTKNLEAALRGAAHVQENAPEKLEAKIPIWAEMDGLAGPDTILASSTSAILPSKFTEKLKGRRRCVVVHPINPPYLVPAVEVVPAPWTAPATVERTASFMRELGQAPIVMKRELDGFVMNRMQGALLQEAFRLVAEGYATPEDIDIGIRDGLGLRWAFMGPFETIDLNAPGGVADYIARYEGIYQRLWPSQQHIVSWAEASPAVETEMKAGLPRERLNERQAWRDRRLMALVAHKRDAAHKIKK
ncbi:3-hydroxyacyl-CoA dehydrogenase [Hypericibacter adhaerens]|uniref:3-hydroxyacyl-CoA dehydrogenase n=1 Tax=Hypericibacter adhaerens TaxID=2602016 RepID=A0A5J6N345_9PROT|nr:3-hydroxyacyl-CoA dehydrogenase [Hypericibacter adhaerens]QEX24181.1 3-hydroxyacyl-CoA dehydrogenase [Hypericibacter adhaerens]